MPSAAIAPIPVIAPVAEISQSLELIATVSPLSPSVISPLAVSVPLVVVIPVIVKALLIVVVPVAAPIESVVAAPPKFIVVAVVFANAKVVESVMREVVIVGDVANTASPVPVSSDKVFNKFADVPVVARLEEESVVINLDAVNPESVIVPLEEMPDSPEMVPDAVILPVLPTVNSVAPEAEAVKISPPVVLLLITKAATADSVAKTATLSLISTAPPIRLPVKVELTRGL